MMNAVTCNQRLLALGLDLYRYMTWGMAWGIAGKPLYTIGDRSAPNLLNRPPQLAAPNRLEQGHMQTHLHVRPNNATRSHQ